MKILHNNTEIIDIEVDDNSYRYRAIKGDHNLTLYFSLAEHVEIPIGSYCVFQNETYTLNKPESLKMQHTRKFEYTAIMEASQSLASRYKFRNPVDRRLKFSLTAKPREFLQMFVDNMNLRDSGWSIGTCIDDVEKTVSFNHVFCREALTQVVEEFDTEYEFVGKQVSLHKVEYNKDNPLALSYGKGNGFKPGIGRSNYEDNMPTEILYTQGGDRNIDASKYGSQELLLPKSQTIKFDGTHFEDEVGYDATKAVIYISDADGYSVRQSGKELVTHSEDSLDCTDIYPSRVGTVSAVVEVNTSKNFYDIIDNTIPEALDYSKCIIAGETMSIIFQSGMLSGRELEVKYIHNVKGDKQARRFELVPQEIDGQTMPGGVYLPAVGDKYAVFNCMLPEAYICDNTTKSGASWDMMRSAIKKLYEKAQSQFTFTGELNGIWAKQDWLNIGGKIKLGGYISFTDSRFQVEPILVRITAVKDYINDPHSPEITLSNTTVGSSVVSALKQIESDEVVVEDKHKNSLQFTRRRFRVAEENQKLLQEALLNYTTAINPITVNTMQILLGDKSLQFEFVSSKTSPHKVAHSITYDKTSKMLHAEAGILRHLTLGIDSLSSTHVASEYKYWDIAEFTTPTLTDSSAYYLYVKVSKTTSSGVFYISASAIGMEDVEGYYHLLCGVLNSEYDGNRAWSQFYGYAEITPAQLVINRIVSPDGSLLIDLETNTIQGNLKFSGGSTVEDAIKDALSYTINIYTSSGNSFTNGVDTTLVAQVMCGKDDVTSTLAAGYFSWRRVSRNTDGDAVWNQLHEGVGSSIHIGDDDVVRSAMFECVVTIDNTTYSSSNNN